MITIDKIEACILDVPTIRGHVLAMTTMHAQSFVLVKVVFSDGSIGIGEGTAIGGLSYCPESPESILSAICTYIAPLLTGKSGDNINQAISLMGRAVQGNSIARAAVEMALWDGLARRMERPISALFGGAIHDRFPVAWTLASGDLATDIEEAKQMLAEKRHNIFKLKIGKRTVRDDVAHVAAIKNAVGEQASIRVDVNQAWSLHDARWGLAGLEEIGVDLVEQPITANDLDGLTALKKGHKIAVMADEALSGPASALAFHGAADVFAVKIAQSGGLKPASEVCAIARAAGLGIYGGTMLESGVGTAAALHLFATLPELKWGTELFGPLLFTDEILATPINYSDFNVEVPLGHGNGVALDDNKVAFYRRDGAKRGHLHAVKT